jgi:hypothetical protein
MDRKSAYVLKKLSRGRHIPFVVMIFMAAYSESNQKSPSLLAQEKPELFTRIERAFQEKEPTWKVESSYVSDSSDPIGQSIVFRSADGQASVEVNIWKREKDAQDDFAALSIGFDSTMGKRMVKGALPNLGDENHIWTLPDSTAWPTIRFRKGKVNIVIFAPSVTIAKRFAQHVLEQLSVS